MNRVIKKIIAFTTFLSIFLVLVVQNITVVAAENGKYSLKVLSENEYSDAVRFADGYLMLKDGNFNGITKDTKIIYIDKDGNKKEIKNDIGFTEIYVNLSGNGYYIDENSIIVKKDGKVAIMDKDGEMFGGVNNFYTKIMKAGEGLFYTIDNESYINGVGSVNTITLRKKDGTFIKEFKNIAPQYQRMNSNSYEYFNYRENNVKKLISIDTEGNIKNIGENFDRFYISNNGKYLVGYESDYVNDKNRAIVMDREGNKIFEVDNCANIEIDNFEKNGYAEVGIYIHQDNRIIYSRNIINEKGNLMLKAGEYHYIKAYDDKMALAIDFDNNIKLVDYANNVKFNSKEFAKKFGESYLPVTESLYYINSTLSVTVIDNNKPSGTSKTFFFDDKINQIASNIEGEVRQYDGNLAILYSDNSNGYKLIKNNGTSITNAYNSMAFEVDKSNKVDRMYGKNDIYNNGSNSHDFDYDYEKNYNSNKKYTGSIVAKAKKANEEKEYLILNTGKYIDKYSSIGEFVNGKAVVRDFKTQGYGIIDLNGNEIVPVGKYDSFIQYAKSPCFVGYKNNDAFIFDKNGIVLNEPNKYKEIGNYITKYIMMYYGDMRQYKNRIFSNNVAITTDKEDKLGLIRVIKSTDVDINGVTDIKDITAVASKYGANNTSSSWIDKYDLNDDGIIDIYDLVMCSKEF